MRRVAPQRVPPAGRPAPVAPHRAKTPAIISIALLTTALLLAPFFLQPADTQAYYLALTLTVLTALPLVTRIASDTLDPFEPIISISILIGLAFGVRTMYLAYDPAEMFFLRTGALRADEFINSALQLTIAAYCSLLAGYYLIAGPVRLPTLASGRWGRGTWTGSRLRIGQMAVLLGFAAVGTIVARPVGADELTSATTPIAILAGLAQVSGFVLALHLAAGDRRRWLRIALWCVAVPLAAWQALIFGAKAPILLMLYGIVAAYHYGRRRIAPRTLVVGAVLATLIVFPVVNAYRAPPGRYIEPPASAGWVGRIASLPTLFDGMTPGEYVQYAFEGVLSRSTGIDALSLLLKYDLSRELGNRTAYWSIPLYAFVPRVIWPAKPFLQQGAEAGRLLNVPSFEGRFSVSSYGIFHLGDLLVTFGVAGALIGMCVLGCLYRLLYKWFDPAGSRDPGIQFLYILVLWYVVNGFESDIPSVYASLLRSLIVWVPIKMWLNARRATHQVRAPGAIRSNMARPHLAR